MTQSPFDSLAKQYLEDFLTPIGIVDRKQISSGQQEYTRQTNTHVDRLSLDYDNVQKINLGLLIIVNGALFLPTVKISKR